MTLTEWPASCLLSRIDAIVLDKTGTLTEGEPSLTDVFALDGRSEDDLLRLVAPAEKSSEHPLAEAIVAGARERGIEPKDASRFEAVAGHGIRAEVDSHAVLMGNRKLMDDSGVDISGLEEYLTRTLNEDA
jgi:cation transport ATPase